MEINQIESANTENSKLIQALAQKLIENHLVEWHKISLKDSRKGYALFFPSDKWELVENELVEITNSVLAIKNVE